MLIKTGPAAQPLSRQRHVEDQFVSFVMCTSGAKSVKNTALIFLEIFLIEYYCFCGLLMMS